MASGRPEVAYALLLLLLIAELGAFLRRAGLRLRLVTVGCFMS